MNGTTKFVIASLSTLLANSDTLSALDRAIIEESIEALKRG